MVELISEVIRFHLLRPAFRMERCGRVPADRTPARDDNLQVDILDFSAISQVLIPFYHAPQLTLEVRKLLGAEG